MFQVRKTRLRAQVNQNTVYTFPATRDGAVNALRGKQESPLETEFATALQQGLLQFPEVRQPYEFVQRGNYNPVICCIHCLLSADYADYRR